MFVIFWYILTKCRLSFCANFAHPPAVSQVSVTPCLIPTLFYQTCLIAASLIDEKRCVCIIVRIGM